MELKLGYKQTEVGVIPEEWDVQACAEVCVKIQDGTHFSPSIGGNDYLYVTSKNIGFGVLDVSNADRIDAAQHKAIYKRCDVRHGDLLLTKDGANTGNTALNTLKEEFSLLSSVAFLRFDPKRHTAGYFLQQILSNPGQRRIKDAMAGNAITWLTLNKIRKLRFPVAPLPEQREIATALSDVDALLGGLDRLIAKKRDLKQAAMQQLLTGQTRLPGFHSEWEVKPIGEFTDCTAGGTPSTLVPSYWGGSIRWMNSGELNLRFVAEVEGRITEAGLNNSSTKVIPKKCVLIGLAGQGKTRGTVAMNLVELCTNQSIAAIFPSPAFVPEYLYHNLYTRYDELRGLSTGDGGRGGLNLAIIKSIPVPLPTTPEQTAIAAVLSDMDAELSALKARHDKARALKQGMMQELLTGRTRLV